ncbi:hypothetical protein O181_035411 [Austropuccinia psidii MF-1]|uniref:Uncharacterized protein n=1 Tax=Austropuccinia psidii MF-1 TaxID=1389203 RepID=A0A9Q3D884_9BASI|nr:hypothetical protein [Austropuccinia psidii MF-1]
MFAGDTISECSFDFEQDIAPAPIVMPFPSTHMGRSHSGKPSPRPGKPLSQRLQSILSGNFFAISRTLKKRTKNVRPNRTCQTFEAKYAYRAGNITLPVGFSEKHSDYQNEKQSSEV